jgi:four helix bundle protein
MYKLTTRFPREQQYLLTSQMRGSAASVPSDIAEGCESDGLDLARFLQFGMRSASEVDYQLILARDLGYITSDEHVPLEKELSALKRILNALVRKVPSEYDPRRVSLDPKAKS